MRWQGKDIHSEFSAIVCHNPNVSKKSNRPLKAYPPSIRPIVSDTH